MPNNTATKFKVTGPIEDVNRFLQAAKGEEINLDFNRLVPMPEELRATTHPIRIKTQEEIDLQWAAYNQKKQAGTLTRWELDDGKPFAVGMTQETYDSLIEKYGYADWYKWSIAKWGTKWNCYSVGEWTLTTIDEKTNCAEIYYETAWSPARPLWLKISTQYPTLEFYHAFADEGGGFLAWEEFKNGLFVDQEEIEWDSDSGIALRKELGAYHPEDEETDA
jgi:Ferredoxin-like domain in Api92-like protein